MKVSALIDVSLLLLCDVILLGPEIDASHHKVFKNNELNNNHSTFMQRNIETKPSARAIPRETARALVRQLKASGPGTTIGKGVNRVTALKLVHQLQSTPVKASEGVPRHVVQQSRKYKQSLPRGKKNLNPKRLRRILGSDFNPKWVSVEKPKITKFLDDSAPSDGKLLADLSLFLNSSSEVTFMDALEVRRVKTLLLRRASCPVHYEWEDRGALFWPRWIRHGQCRDHRPCSWPPGMHCVPAQSHTISVLRWHCRRRHGKRSSRQRDGGRGHRSRLNPRLVSGRRPPPLFLDTRVRISRQTPRKKTRMKCKWLKVPYPVTNHCYCSC